MKHFSRIDIRTKLLLLLFLLIASFFRFYNPNWDGGHLFHPDERNIANAVSGLSLFSQMDPKFYAYGGFLIYVYKATADFLAYLMGNPIIAKDWGWINVIGRSYSAFFSVLTIIPLFFLGKKLFDKKTALIACFLYTFTVTSIQTAHFSITENILTFLLLLLCLLSLVFFEKPHKKLLLLIGLVIGIAVASKTTGISFFLLPTIALLLLVVKRRVSIFYAVLSFFLLSLTAFTIFTLFSPYTFLNFDKFLESMRYENSVVLGTNRVVYTLQFSHSLPYFFQLKNLFWQIGPFMIFSLLGIPLLFYHELKKKRAIFLVFISFPVFYFLYVGSWYTKFIRYMVPLIPFFLLFGSYFLTEILKRYRRLGLILISVSAVFTVIWAVAFFSIYTKEQTRITASEWIYQHIPPQKFLLSEHWDEGLPIPLTTGSPDQYQQLPLTIYEPDNEIKLDYYANYLSQADYVTITTRRLYGTLINLPEKYPLTQRYYQQLFSGGLGYEKVAEFASYPTLFGITINDDASEETFQVYDHPKAMIFKNTKHYSFQQLKDILTKNQN